MLEDVWTNDIKTGDLKREKGEQIFQSLMPLFQKHPKQLLWFALPDDIHFLSLS